MGVTKIKVEFDPMHSILSALASLGVVSETVAEIRCPMNADQKQRYDSPRADDVIEHGDEAADVFVPPFAA